ALGTIDRISISLRSYFLTDCDPAADVIQEAPRLSVWAPIRPRVAGVAVRSEAPANQLALQRPQLRLPRGRASLGSVGTKAMWFHIADVAGTLPALARNEQRGCFRPPAGSNGAPRPATAAELERVALRAVSRAARRLRGLSDLAQRLLDIADCGVVCVVDPNAFRACETSANRMRFDL
ncbi:unnamed protein product, partial [Prorocentrum cordatum]